MFFNVIFVLTILSFGVNSQELTENFSKCRFDDSQCLVDTIQNIFNKNFEGKPELGLRSLDPLFVDQMSISQGGDGPINIVIDFWNASVTGIKNAIVTKVSGFKQIPESNKLDMRMQAPLITIFGPYKGKGKVMLLPVYGSGFCNFTLGNPRVIMKYLTKKVEKDGETFMQIDRFKVNFETDKLYMHFTGLFNGDKVLGDNLNVFLNENWKDLLEELKPAITNAFGTVFREVINGVFAKIPYKNLFLE